MIRAAWNRVLCACQRHGRRCSRSRAQLAGGGTLVVRVRPRVDLAEKQNEIQAYVNKYNQLAADKKVASQSVSAVPAADRAVHSVRRHLDRAAAGAADQRADFRAAGGGQRSAQGQSGPSRERAKAIDELATLVRALQRNDAGAGSQQPRARKPPPVHRSDSRKHSHRRDLADRRRPHPARESRAARPVSGRSRSERAGTWAICFRPRTPPKSTI